MKNTVLSQPTKWLAPGILAACFFLIFTQLSIPLGRFYFMKPEYFATNKSACILFFIILAAPLYYAATFLCIPYLTRDSLARRDFMAFSQVRGLTLAFLYLFYHQEAMSLFGQIPHAEYLALLFGLVCAAGFISDTITTIGLYIHKEHYLARAADRPCSYFKLYYGKRA